MQEAQEFQTELNRLVEQMNRLKNEYMQKYASKGVESVDFESFQTHYNNVLDLKKDWMRALKRMQKYMRTQEGMKFPPEVQRINGLLEKMLSRVQAGQKQIEKFKEAVV